MVLTSIDVKMLASDDVISIKLSRLKCTSTLFEINFGIYLPITKRFTKYSITNKKIKKYLVPDFQKTQHKRNGRVKFARTVKNQKDLPEDIGHVRSWNNYGQLQRILCFRYFKNNSYHIEIFFCESFPKGEISEKIRSWRPSQISE